MILVAIEVILDNDTILLIKSIVTFAILIISGRIQEVNSIIEIKLYSGMGLFEIYLIFSISIMWSILPLWLSILVLFHHFILLKPTSEIRFHIRLD